MKNFLTLLVLAFLILIVSQYLRNSGLSPPEFPDTISSYGKLPDSGHLLRTDGRKIPLSALRGRVVFLCFWATWCPPCRAEMPSIQNLYNILKKEKNVAFLMISHEDRATLHSFMKKNSYAFPVYHADETLAAALNVTAVPTTFIADRKGNIVLRHNGAAKWDDKSCIDFFKKLM